MTVLLSGEARKNSGRRPVSASLDDGSIVDDASRRRGNPEQRVIAALLLRGQGTRRTRAPAQTGRSWPISKLTRVLPTADLHVDDETAGPLLGERSQSDRPMVKAKR